MARFGARAAAIRARLSRLGVGPLVWMGPPAVPENRRAARISGHNRPARLPGVEDAQRIKRLAVGRRGRSGLGSKGAGCPIDAREQGPAERRRVLSRPGAEAAMIGRPGHRRARLAPGAGEFPAGVAANGRAPAGPCGAGAEALRAAAAGRTRIDGQDCAAIPGVRRGWLRRGGRLGPCAGACAVGAAWGPSWGRWSIARMRRRGMSSPPMRPAA